MKGESILKGNAFFEQYIRKNFVKYIVVLFIYIVGFLVGIRNVSTSSFNRRGF